MPSPTNVRSGKLLHVEAPNKVGVLAEVSGTFAAKGINILSMSAYEHENQGAFWLITDNNSAGASELRKKGYTVEEADVILCDLPNQPGTLAPVAKILGDSRINIRNCFFTGGPSNNTVTCVFYTDNNPKAMQSLQQMGGRKAA